MATITTHAQALFTVPFSHNTDFNDLADHCEHFAHNLLETDDPAEKMALCARLSACLVLLQPTLHEPIPPHLVERFTLTDLPSRLPVFEPESELLGAVLPDAYAAANQQRNATGYGKGNGRAIV
ncbi:Uncharacterised protein [Enterobacter kobei]|nr:Uncharacterised protein [Enterobacter kobei]